MTIRAEVLQRLHVRGTSFARWAYDRIRPESNAGEGASLPLGVDLSPHGVGIVAARLIDGEFVVTQAQWQSYPGWSSHEQREESARVICDLVENVQTAERRCVLAVPGTEVVTKSVEAPPRASKRQLDSFAQLQADRFTAFADFDRIVTVDSLDAQHLMLSIARKQDVERIAGLARSAGLKPVAVDIAWCAWQRALPERHALLDLRGEEPLLSVFARTVNDTIIPGATYGFAPNVTDATIASKIANACMEQRRDTGCDMQLLAVSATMERYEEISGHLAAIGGFTVEPVTVASRVLPPWAFAFGLATWSRFDMERAA